MKRLIVGAIGVSLLSALPALPAVASPEAIEISQSQNLISIEFLDVYPCGTGESCGRYITGRLTNNTEQVLTYGGIFYDTYRRVDGRERIVASNSAFIKKPPRYPHLAQQVGEG
ncbi:MAG: hypothetical protein ACFB8W_19435 [Elainellaceae cyanobacterium]